MNSDVRIYRVYKDGEPATNVEFKGLAQKEKEIVVSNLNISDEFQALIDAEPTTTDFSRFYIGEVDILTEDMLIEYAQSPDSLDLWVVKITEDDETVIFDPTA